MVRVLVSGTGSLPANCKIRAIYLNTSEVETRKKASSIGIITFS